MVIEFTPVGLAYVVFRQRRAIVGFILAGLVLTVAFCLWATPRYEADSSLVVTFNRQLTGSTTASDQSSNNGPANSAQADEIINSYALVFQNTALATRVIDGIGLAQMYPGLTADTAFSRFSASIKHALGTYTTPLEAAVDRFVKHDIDVEVVKDSSIIKVALYNPNPEVARRALAMLIDQFLQQQALIGRDPQLGFAQSQVVIYGKQVARAQSAMTDFQLKNHISSMEDENSYLLKQRSDLESQRATDAVQIEQDRHKITALSAQLSKLNETIELHQQDRDAAIDAARTQLVALQVLQQSLSTEFNADSVLLRNTNAEIGKVEDFIKTYHSRQPVVQEAPNPTYEVIQSDLLQAQADFESATRSLPTLQTQIDTISARLAEHLREQATYQDLVREYQIDDENYRAYLQTVQQARVAQDLNNEKATSIAVYEPAYLRSSLPAKPKKSLLIFAGTLLGVIFGLTTAFLRESWDERLNRPRQVNVLLGMRVLGSTADLAGEVEPPVLRV
jgi:uncharacterized protein involved in exopolysaccharide biosynthesis